MTPNMELELQKKTFVNIWLRACFYSSRIRPRLANTTGTLLLKTFPTNIALLHYSSQKSMYRDFYTLNSLPSLLLALIMKHL